MKIDGKTAIITGGASGLDWAGQQPRLCMSRGPIL